MYSTLKVLFFSLSLYLFSSCSDSSGGSSVDSGFGGVVAGASSAMDDGIPSLGGASSSSLSFKLLSSPISSLAAVTLDSTNWDSSGNTLPPLGDGSGTPVTVVDYVGQALNSSYSLPSEEGSVFPTVFGRFEGDLEVLTAILSANGVTLTNGVPTPGSYDVTSTIEGTAFNVTFDATATTDTTYYDVFVNNITVSGLGALTFNALMRNSATELNLLTTEFGEFYSYSILNWNKSTGVLRYEYVSDRDTGSDATGQLETHRLYIDADGMARLISFGGRSIASDPDAQAVSVVADGGENATEASVSVHYNSGSGDTITGLICANAQTGAHISDGSCASATGIDISTLPAFITDLKAVVDPADHTSRLNNLGETQTVTFTDESDFETAY